MNIWFIVAAVGFVLSLVGMVVLVIQYRQGRYALAELLTYVIGYIVFIGIVAWSEFAGRPRWIQWTPIYILLWYVVVLFVRRKTRSNADRGARPSALDE
jgi:hypothetical protein